MTTFVDTSAILAVLDRTDHRHEPCAETWTALAEGDEPLVTSSYVLVELISLAQRRLGWESVRAIDTAVTPVLDVAWTDAADHRAGLTTLLQSKRRKLSLVDCVSFAVMRRLRISRAFTLDRQFRQAGFRVVPD